MSGRVNRGTQTTVRLSEDFKNKMEAAAIADGLPLTEWIRRACEEKLSRAKNPDVQRIKRLEEDVDMLKQFIRASSKDVDEGVE